MLQNPNPYLVGGLALLLFSLIAGVVRYFRTDTAELVQERAMTIDERQTEIPVAD